MIERKLNFSGELHPKFMGKLPMTKLEVRMNKMISSLSEAQQNQGHELGLLFRGRMPQGWKPQPKGLKARWFYLTKMWWRQYL